jgi:hypothetical protein
MQQKVGAMLQAADILFVVRVDILVALAGRYAVPTIYIGSRWVRAISYGG